MNDRQKNVALYCDGVLTSKEIAALCGDNHKYVQKTMLRFDLPRRGVGSAFGDLNGSFCCGRKIDLDGYALVSAPHGHPHTRHRKGRNTGVILEHRLVMEDNLGRYLDPKEVVDHIDGLRLHNEPSNLRLFSSNSEHLKQTISGQTPKWSKEGREKQFLTKCQRTNSKRVDNYGEMKKRGDARLRQILLAALKLGIDSPFLLGSSHHLKKAGISDHSHSNLKRELEALYLSWQ